MSEVGIPWQRDNASGSDSHQVRTRDFCSNLKSNTGAQRSGVALFATAGPMPRPCFHHWTTWRVKHNVCRKTPPSFFCIMLEETQKAPSTIALTKINAVQIASTLSFIVTSTRRTSIAVARNRKSNRKSCRSEANGLLQCRVFGARHSSMALGQHHEICRHFSFGKKVPGGTKNI
jgi:hypothetical protein